MTLSRYAAVKWMAEETEATARAIAGAVTLLKHFPEPWQMLRVQSALFVATKMHDTAPMHRLEHFLDLMNEPDRVSEEELKVDEIELLNSLRWTVPKLTLMDDVEHLLYLYPAAVEPATDTLENAVCNVCAQVRGGRTGELALIAIVSALIDTQPEAAGPWVDRLPMRYRTHVRSSFVLKYTRIF